MMATGGTFRETLQTDVTLGSLTEDSGLTNVLV